MICYRNKLFNKKKKKKRDSQVKNATGYDEYVQDTYNHLHSIHLAAAHS